MITLPKPPAPIQRPSAPAAKVQPPPPPPAKSAPTAGASSFQPAPARPPLVLSPPPPPSVAAPATTLHSERLGDGQRNCLERAYGLAQPSDTVVLLADRRDASGHAVVQHPDGSVTDPNQPSQRYPSLAAWQSSHPQYHQPVSLPQPALAQVLKTPPGPAREALIHQLGLSAIAGRAVADSEPVAYVTPNDGPLNLRSDPNTGGAVLGHAPEGSIIEVMGDVNSEGWAPIRYTPAGSSEPIEGYAHVGDFTEELPPEQAKSLLESQEIYVHQLDAEKEVSFTPAGKTEPVQGNGANANCGPTSLLMAFRQQGLELPAIPGVTGNGTDGADVQAARFAMYGIYDGASAPANDSEREDWSKKDGVVEVPAENGGPVTYQYADMNLNYAQGGENSQETGFHGMARAVHAAHGYVEDVQQQSGSYTQSIVNELEQGRTVILSGDFSTGERRPVMATSPDQPQNAAGERVDRHGNVITEPVPKEGEMWPHDSSATRHIVAITGMVGSADDGTLRFIVNDPINPNRGPVLVTPEQLATFMDAPNAGAIAIGGRDDPALAASAQG